MSEDVLVLIKPDGMRKNLVGHIMSKFTGSDLGLVGLKIVAVSKKQARAHYAPLKGKAFYNDIVGYLMGKEHQGAAVVAMVFRGKDAISKCRQIAGATNPEEADARSVRGSFGRITTKGLWENAVHVSSDKDESRREIKLWFKANEILKDKI